MVKTGAEGGKDRPKIRTLCHQREEKLALAEKQPETETDSETLTDGFHLLIDALKLNGLNTIYNVPAIPITDLGPYAQAQALRVISSPH